MELAIILFVLFICGLAVFAVVAQGIISLL